MEEGECTEEEETGTELSNRKEAISFSPAGRSTFPPVCS